jgi:hypothetical protein
MWPGTGTSGSRSGTGAARILPATWPRAPRGSPQRRIGATGVNAPAAHLVSTGRRRASHG